MGIHCWSGREGTMGIWIYVIIKIVPPGVTYQEYKVSGRWQRTCKEVVGFYKRRFYEKYLKW